MRLLYGFRKRRALLDLVMTTDEVERRSDRRVPETGDDRKLLVETLESLTERRVRMPHAAVFLLVPAGSESQHDAPVAHRVDLSHGDRQRSREPERRGAHHRAQPDPFGLAARPASVTHESVGPGSPASPNPR